jgi:hypothetical protein
VILYSQLSSGTVKLAMGELNKDHSKPTSEVNSDDPTTALVLAMADTTWRMVVPPAVLVTGGLYADIHWGTRPWLTLLGTALGLAIGILLVRSLMRRLA